MFQNITLRFGTYLRKMFYLLTLHCLNGNASRPTPKNKLKKYHCFRLWVKVSCKSLCSESNRKPFSIGVFALCTDVFTISQCYVPKVLYALRRLFVLQTTLIAMIFFTHYANISALRAARNYALRGGLVCLPGGG